jgi:hypothetical protein
MIKLGSTAVILILLIRTGTGQVNWPTDSNNSFPWIADSVNHMNNFYDFDGNPASLFEDETSKQLWIGHVSDYYDGAFHHPFEPKSLYNQRYFVQTSYPIDENDLFKGFFTYTRQNDRDVMWADQSRNLDWNPYIFADSSTGDFELSGLSWAGEWAHRLSSNWLAGATFYYNVDQRLKQVFPKPLNSHRDIVTKIGTQYRAGNMSFAAHYQYLDEQEQVEITKYNLNQDLTPLIYKFRYSDLPLILRGKTSDERKSELSTHQLNIQGRWKNNVWNVLFAGCFGKTTGNTIDGGNRNDEQGKLERTSIGSKLKVERDWVRTKVSFSYGFQQNKLNANHPDFNLETIQHPSTVHNAQLGLINKLSIKTSIFGEVKFHWLQNQYEDRMTANYWKYAQQQWGGKAGIIRSLGKHWTGTLWGGYSQYSYSDLLTQETIYTEYFNILFRDNLNYLTGGEDDFYLGSKIVYHFLPVFEAELNTYWYQINSTNSDRKNFYADLMVKIYIF